MNQLVIVVSINNSLLIAQTLPQEISYIELFRRKWYHFLPNEVTE